MSIDLPEQKAVDTFYASLVYDLIARDHIGPDYIQTVNKLHYHTFYLRDSADIVAQLRRDRLPGDRPPGPGFLRQVAEARRQLPLAGAAVRRLGRGRLGLCAALPHHPRQGLRRVGAAADRPRRRLAQAGPRRRPAAHHPGQRRARQRVRSRPSHRLQLPRPLRPEAGHRDG